jgi:hypothetical protein
LKDKCIEFGKEMNFTVSTCLKNEQKYELEDGSKTLRMLAWGQHKDCSLGIRTLVTCDEKNSEMWSNYVQLCQDHIFGSNRFLFDSGLPSAVFGFMYLGLIICLHLELPAFVTFKDGAHVKPASLL